MRRVAAAAINAAASAIDVPATTATDNASTVVAPAADGADTPTPVAAAADGADASTNADVAATKASSTAHAKRAPTLAIRADTIDGGIQLLSIRRRAVPVVVPPGEFVYLIVKGRRTGKFATRYVRP